MTASRLAAVKVVLYESQDPVNIGGVVRGMKNMGLRDLRLVRPTPYDVTRIEQIAHDTRDIVARIRHFETLDEALADCVRVFAFSGRRRATRWAMHTPRSMVDEAFEHLEAGPVALLFGREDHGLPSEAIDRAHALVTIPTTDHFSLNVAQAALLGMYELHVAAGDATRTLGRPRKATAPPTAQESERTFHDVEAALRAIAYFKTRNPELIMRTVRSLVFRASPDARELTMLRTASIEVLRTLEREKRALLRRIGLAADAVESAMAEDAAEIAAIRAAEAARVLPGAVPSADDA
jgi:tRNA/rRNA methyltransferase/tRNA (cytidine32/uridine32-2'-O)-methyltransferase